MYFPFEISWYSACHFFFLSIPLLISGCVTTRPFQNYWGERSSTSSQVLLQPFPPKMLAFHFICSNRSDLEIVSFSHGVGRFEWEIIKVATLADHVAKCKKKSIAMLFLLSHWKITFFSSFIYVRPLIRDLLCLKLWGMRRKWRQDNERLAQG